MYPSGGGANTTLAGQVCFNAAKNNATVIAGTTVFVLDGMYDDWKYFDPDSLDYLGDLSTENVSNLVAGVGTNPNCIDISQIEGTTLTPGAAYTTVVKNVCMVGYSASEMEYCSMDFRSFTTAAGEGAAAASLYPGPDVPSNFLDGSKVEYFFPGDTNQGIFKFNIYGSDTLSQVKVCALSTDDYSVVEKVRLYRDKTSSTNSNGNHILEPGIDPQLAETTTWTSDGAGNHCATLTISPAFTLPTENPNGSLGFITFDFSGSATLNEGLTPFFVENSFILSDVAVKGHMNTAISGVGTTKWGRVQITTNANQQAPYIQNLAPTTAIGPNTKATALGIDFWDPTGVAYLESLTVDIVVPSGGDFDPAYGLSALSTDQESGVVLYRDDGSSAGQFDEGDTCVSMSSVSAWQTLSGFTKRTVLTLSPPQHQATDNTGGIGGINPGPDYFVRVKTSSSPAPGSSFKVRIPKDGFVDTFPSTDIPSSSINIQSGGGPVASGLVISEVKTGTGDDDFIELYNPTNASVNLKDYCLVSRAANESATDTTIKVLPADAFIPAYGFYLWSNTNYTTNPAADVQSGATLGNDMGIALRQEAGGTIIDSVAWGTVDALHAFKEGEATSNPSENNSIERKSWSNATATDMAANGMDEKMGNGEDSNNNFMDFVSQTTTTLPQSTVSTVEDPNSATEGGGDNATPVVINEVFYNTATKGGWIELFNRTGAAVEIIDWTIAASSQTYTFPGSTSISPNGYVIVHWNDDGTETNSGNNFYSNSTVNDDMSTIAGDVILKDNSSPAAIKDYVQYGGVGQANQTNALGATPPEWLTGDYVPNAMYGQSIGRNSSSGADANRASDWQTFSTLTQGTVNSGGDAFPPDAVTSVELEDTDITHYGIDGRDVTVRWTPASADPTFDKYEIYLLPSTTPFSASTHTPIANLYGDQTTLTWTGGPGNTYDSAGDALAIDDYRAYVIAKDLSGNSSSAAVSTVGELASSSDDTAAGTDASPPMMMHSPISTIQSGQPIKIVARFGDDRAVVGAVGEIPLLTGKVNYSFFNASSEWEAWDSSIATSAGAPTVTDLGNGYYQFNVPWQASATDFKYYLEVDDTVNVSYMSASPIADETDSGAVGGTTANVEASPFVVNVEAAGSFNNSISGYVYNNAGVALIADNVKVSIIGLSLAATGVHPSTGAYSFANVPDGSYTLQAMATDYMSMDIGPVNLSGTNAVESTGNNFYLNPGQSGGGMMSGDMDSPFVTWTTPFDGSTSASLDISANFCPVSIGFSEPMDPNTIIDNDTSNSGSNIYLTTNGLDRIVGAISYNSTTYEATFTSGTTLSPSTGYALVVTPGVMDEAGNPLMGNQADGAFVASFQTMFDMTGSDYTGGYDNYSDNYSANYGTSGAMMPPYVVGTVPSPGAFNVNTDSIISIEFSEPILSSSVVSATGQTTDWAIQLLRISSSTDWTGVNVPITVSLDNQTSKIATITPVDGSDVKTALAQNVANEGWYQIVVTGAVQSNTGAYMGDPGSGGNTASNAFYTSDFQVNYTAADATDGTSPFVTGSYPSAGNTDIQVNIPVIDIGFSEPMNPSTISGSTITLKAGSNSISGQVEYDPMGNSARFMPSAVLSANTLYTLKVLIGAQDLAGKPLVQTINASTAGNYVITFTTGPADSTAPTVLYANADDYSIAVTFSEAMNTSKATASAALWGASVLNPANYYVNSLSADYECASPGSWSCSPSLMTPYDTVGGKQVSVIQEGISISYDFSSMTVTLKGFSFLESTDGFQIFVDNVTDKANNILLDNEKRLSGTQYRNAARAPMQKSEDTYGMLGPGGGGMMMMGPMGGGGMGGGSAMGGGGMPAGGGGMPSSTMGPGMDMGMMGMMGGGVMPMNMMAGQTSIYFVDIPVTQSVPKDGTIVLTFPSGFNVAGAIKDPNSPLNNDINEWAEGTVGFEVTKDPVSRTITLTIKSGQGFDATLANDFLHLDLKGIVNSPIPKGFGTSGYTVDIKTMSSDGALLENITTMPFYIQEAGAYSISGDIHGVDDGDDGTITVFLGSPMTGPMEKDVDITGNGSATADGSFLFTGLPSGEYYLFTEPSMTIGAGTYMGNPMPEPIWVSNASVEDKDIVLTTESANATAITVTLQGDFTTGSSNDNVDIFAGSPSGFRVKTVTPADDLVTKTHPENYTFYLPDGHWMVGIGPAMPKGAMMGPALMPDWMPPMSVDVDVTNGAEIEVRETSGTDDNDGTIVFNISSQTTYQIKGQVIDNSGNGIASAEVWAFSPMGGMGGSNTKTDASGNFTLKVGVPGFYQVGAHKPGIPGGKEKTVDVRTGGNYVGGVQIVTNANFQIALKKPAHTISGKVLNSDSQAVAYAPVWTHQQDGWGHADTMTDSSGNYILYVDDGTWFIETDAPGVGWLQYDLPVVISGASQSNINLKPATDIVWKTISGIVGVDTDTALTTVETPLAYMPIRAVQYLDPGEDGIPEVYSGREYMGMTDSAGAYKISVPAGYYRVDIWTPEYGEVERTNADDFLTSPANTDASSGNVTANIVIATAGLRTITLDFTNAVAGQEGFLHIEEVNFGSPARIDNPVKHTGFSKKLRINDLTAGGTVKLRDGYYFFGIDVPGVGHYIPDATSRDATFNCIIVSAGAASQTVTFVLPNTATEMITITGNVTSSSTALAGAWFFVGNPTTGFNTGCTTATNGTCSVTVPLLANGTYKASADKLGYMSAKSVNVSGSSPTPTVAISLTAQSNVISGYMCDDLDSDYVCSVSERVPNGHIRAEETETGKMSFASVDGAGYFEVGVDNGNWKVYGSADGYLETQYSETGVPVVLNINNNNHTSRHFILASDSNWVVKTKSKSIKPSTGGVIDDTATGGSGMKVTVPAQALGSSTSSGSISVSETSAVSSTNSAIPFAGKGKEISALDNSGQPITDLNDYIDVDLTITKAEVDAEVASGAMTDLSKLEPLQMSYWDDTVQNWTSLPTTKNAYYKDTGDTEWTMYTGGDDPDDNKTDMEEFVEDALVGTTFTAFTDYKLVLSASTNHMSVYGATGPTDALSPSAPATLAQTSGTGTSVGLSWTYDGTNTDSTTCLDFAGYEVYRCLASGTCPAIPDSNYTQVNSVNIAQGTLTFTDDSTNPSSSPSTPVAFASYYYVVSTGDQSGNESYTSKLLVCSNNTVSNGTITDSCAITCNSGYIVSGNSCVSSGGGGGISAPAMPITTSGKVTATYSAGGKTTITTTENIKVSVKLPAYAVSTSTKIAIAPVEVSATALTTAPAIVVSAVSAVPVSKSIVGGNVYNMTATSSGVAVSSFSKEAIITLYYTDAQISGLEESTLAINYWDEANEEWVALETTVYKTSNKVKAKTLHFTYFGIMGETDADVEEGEVVGITQAQIREQINNIMKQIIVLITKLIAVYQAQLLELQTAN